ncbi:MAG TPA: molybdopterin oxidoreductase family protein, partial [Candidatus Acidoferrum sp.]|nr:molybdopterin oxidoreductase family protein [Candidatus Acidoferrum sp.]
YPVNLGMACPKGWEALTPLAAPDRATTPLLRNEAGEIEATDWDTALQVFTVRMKAIQDQHGAESVAWIGTGQITNEELAFLGALGKFGMGMIHGDGNTRQCMATSVVAYKESFGFDAPPYTYKDFEESDVIVLVGSNLCIAHPIMWQRVLMNQHQPEIIVIDPRRTETATAATQHYAIKPKSDLVLLYGLARMLIERGWIDREFIEKSTNEFGEFERFLFAGRAGCPQPAVNGAERRGEDTAPYQAFDVQSVAAVTGISVEQLHHLAETIHTGKRVSFWWTMGVNQGHEATRTAQAIINLALMTGNVGRPGTGANSITGQCNAMGSRLFSNTTNLIGGHDFTKADHREKVARALKIPVERVPQRGSMAYDQILDGIEAGKIKALWIVATNTAHSWIQQKRARELLGKLDFLVVQDMYASTETAQQAHLVLPAAGWGEKKGTFINSERRFGVLKKVSRTPGQALSDFRIFQLVAHYWGCAEMFAEWTSPQAVFQILKRVSAGQPCDITGIEDYRMIDECGGVQWPWPKGKVIAKSVISNQSANDDSETLITDSLITDYSAPATERRLFEDGRFYHSDGRARFIFETPRAMPEPSSREFPLILLTGRGTSAQWHTQTRTGKSAVLRKLAPENIYVEVSPEDAAHLDIESGQRVRVRSPRGEVIAAAFITTTVAKGQVFMPMHYAETN